jgi:hypothetical protein
MPNDKRSRYPKRMLGRGNGHLGIMPRRRLGMCKPVGKIPRLDKQGAQEMTTFFMSAADKCRTQYPVHPAFEVGSLGPLTVTPINSILRRCDEGK